MNVTPATYKVLYDNKNITKDISDHIISLSYTDKVEGESDEMEINLEDTDLLWQNAWYPEKGARLEVEIEQDGFILNCGSFTIDEIEMSSSRGGDTVTIRGLAAFITQDTRTKKSSGHENKTLREIAATIAKANGLQVVGTIADITFKRITQYQETDLGFLKRLAADYGYTFSIRDNVITFTNVYDLEGRAHVLTIDKTDLLSHSMKDKTAETYKAATIKHHDSAGNVTIEETFKEDTGNPLNSAQFIGLKKAISNLKAAITNAIIPALKKQDAKRLAVLPQLTQVKIKQDIQTITNITTSNSLKAAGHNIYKFIPEYVNACSRGDFKTVEVFENLLSRYVIAATAALNMKVHSKVKGDTLHIKTKVENQAQAQEKVKSALHRANGKECTGSISMPGNTLIIAGNNFELTGMGTLSGINHIVSSTHSIGRGGGYVTSAEIKRVGSIDGSKHKPRALRAIGNADAQRKGINGTGNDYSFKNATTAFINQGAVNTFGQ